MNPDNNQTPDYSFITDQQPLQTPKKSNNLKLIILIVVCLVFIVLLVVGASLSSVKENTVNSEASQYVVEGFILPLQSGKYTEVADFVTINDEESQQSAAVNIENTFKSFDANSCEVVSGDSKQPISNVLVSCQGDNKQLNISFAILSGENSQGLVNKEITIE